MPTFKHPCPYCDKFIDRAVRACPFCGQVDPFAPRRCQNCRKIIDDSAWTVCPSCGQSLVAPVAPAADRKSTRLNSSHANISYAVFCLKKKEYVDAVLDEHDGHAAVADAHSRGSDV